MKYNDSELKTENHVQACFFLRKHGPTIFTDSYSERARIMLISPESAPRTCTAMDGDPQLLFGWSRGNEESGKHRAESLNGTGTCLGRPFQPSFPYRHLSAQTLDWFEEPEHFFKNAFSRKRTSHPRLR
jgi:hypothetical protein